MKMIKKTQDDDDTIKKGTFIIIRNNKENIKHNFYNFFFYLFLFMIFINFFRKLKFIYKKVLLYNFLFNFVC